MELMLKKAVKEALGTKLEPFGYSQDSQRWNRELTVKLDGMTRTKIREFRALLETVNKLPTVKHRIQDIDRWLAILDGDKVRCKKISDLAPMLREYLKKAPKHWVYERRDLTESYQPYYVSNIHYEPPKKDRHWTTPAYVTMTLWSEEFGSFKSTVITWHAEDCADLTVTLCLAQKGLMVETPEMLEVYKANVRKYNAIYNKIGKQFLAVGIAEDEGENSRDSWWRRRSRIHLDKDGVPSRVVIDVLKEGDEEEKTNRRGPDAKYWMRDACDFEGSPDDDDADLKPGEEDDEDPAETEIPEIPLSPAVKCFDLRRHTRLTLYIEQLTEYQYQTNLANKLILPDETTRLVDMLVSHKGGFKDIVGNKGHGAVILCAGPPGTGKTLTSEIYSEAMQKPLYSVQCSQLGTDPDELEKQLLKSFARAERWNAILLLDEADVYVAARGSDLTQNAIVGVFLRVLEYYGGILFMTTNRVDLVDDAVLSRCLARIEYAVPTRNNQARIWRTLADTAGITIADTEIRKIVDLYPNLSGRDVKNLLKLASMVAAADGADGISANTVQYVKAFKPTLDVK